MASGRNDRRGGLKGPAHIPGDQSAVRRSFCASRHRLAPARQGLAVDGIVGPRTERALINAGATQPPGGATPSPYPPPVSGLPVNPDHDPSIEALNLAEPARSAAYHVKAKHPWMKFTCGRRDLAGQARAMAGNVVKDRKWIIKTYARNRAIEAAQRWVDEHPEARTQQAIADGLLAVFQSLPASEVGRISRHLVGLAFDISPVPAQEAAVARTILSLPGLSDWRTNEGGLTIWHAAF